jgi:hypothetical protein
MFFLELGKILPRPGEKKSHGEWHFLVELCEWRLDNGKTIIVGSNDDQDFIDDRFKQMDLGVVEHADASPPMYDLTVAFSSGTTLKTFATSAAYAIEEDTQWLLFGPDENVWVVRAGGRHAFVNRDK